MNYRRLGKSGLKLSEISLGTWVNFGQIVDEVLAVKIMSAARDSGVNFYDCAETYANGNAEIVLGKAIKTLGLKREATVISSKVKVIPRSGEGPNEFGLSRKHIHDACAGSLKRLQVDYIDLFFCHRPDPETPIEETVRAMDDLVHQGKILYWGTSEWSAPDIMQAYEISREFGLTPPTMEQSQYNVFRREKMEKEFLPLFREFGLGVTTFSPLAGGVLTGKYSKGFPENSRAGRPEFQHFREHIYTEERINKAREIEPVAKELGCSLGQLSLAWCLKNPNVSSAINGATSPEQFLENVKALEVVPKLDSEVMQRLNTTLGNKPDAAGAS